MNCFHLLGKLFVTADTSTPKVTLDHKVTSSGHLKKRDSLVTTDVTSKHSDKKDPFNPLPPPQPAVIFAGVCICRKTNHSQQPKPFTPFAGRARATFLGGKSFFTFLLPIKCKRGPFLPSRTLCIPNSTDTFLLSTGFSTHPPPTTLQKWTPTTLIHNIHSILIHLNHKVTTLLNQTVDIKEVDQVVQFTRLIVNQMVTFVDQMEMKIFPNYYQVNELQLNKSINL